MSTEVRRILLQADSKNRVSLAKFGVEPHTKYWYTLRSDGSIILTPVESRSS